MLQFIAKTVFPKVEKQNESEDKSEDKTQVKAADFDILMKLSK